MNIFWNNNGSIRAVADNDVTRESLKARINVSVANENVWRKFQSVQMEMIVNKAGRSLFPKMEFAVTGLEPQNCYLISLGLPLADSFRHKYSKDEYWHGYLTQDRIYDNPPEYPHPDNARFPSGSHWMEKNVVFERLKLTNSAETAKDNIFFCAHLKTFRKYRPKIIIYRFDPSVVKYERCYEKEFPLSDFIAVTSYHNAKITEIKADQK